MSQAFTRRRKEKIAALPKDVRSYRALVRKLVKAGRASRFTLVKTDKGRLMYSGIYFSKDGKTKLKIGLHLPQTGIYTRRNLKETT